MFRTISRSFFAALLLIGLVPLAILGAVIIRLQRTVLLDQSTRELQAVSSAVALNLDNYMNELLHDTRLVASLPDVHQMDPAQQQLMLTHVYEESDRFGQMAIIDLDRRVQLTARPQELGQIKMSRSFGQASSGVQSWVLSPWPFSPGLAIHIHTPLQNEENEMLGVMGAAVPLTVMTPLLTQFDLGERDEIFVLNRDNFVLIHPDQEKFEQSQSQPYDHMFALETRPTLRPLKTRSGWVHFRGARLYKRMERSISRFIPTSTIWAGPS